MEFQKEIDVNSSKKDIWELVKDYNQEHRERRQLLYGSVRLSWKGENGIGIK